MLAERRFRGALAACLLCATAGVGATGCTATVTATPLHTHVLFAHSVVRVQTVPVRIYERPHVVYRGRDAYLVGSRWYYPLDDGWVYFAEEPGELRRYRETHADSRHPHRASPRRLRSPREHGRRRYYD